MKYKAIIFDLDGTLLDTSRDIMTVLNASLSAFSLPKITVEQTKAYVGDGARKLVERAVSSEKAALVPEVYAHYVKNFSTCDNELATFYKGEEELLTELKSLGVRLAILTNKPQAATERVYSLFFSRFGFGFVGGQTEGRPLKPAPDGVFEAAKKMGVEVKNCLFVGDGETDVQTSHNARVDGVAALWGYRSRSTLAAAGATVFAENYAALRDMILKS